MKPYKLFKNEITRLRRLYCCSIVSYENSVLNSDIIYNKNIDGTVYYKDIQDRDHILFNSIKNIHKSYNNKFPKLLRQIVFIRIISALEVYLIDSVTELFLNNKTLFMSNDIHEFHQSELLSYKSIADLYTKLNNKITRDLHNGGFKAIDKYYKKVFKIDFNDFSIIINGTDYNKSKIQEYHDKRHIIVHRLGSTDTLFRNKYNSNEHKIILEEDYFLNSINCIWSFSAFIENKLNSLYNFNSKNNNNGQILECNIDIELLCENAANVVSHNYNFMVGENIVILKDILQFINYSNEHNVSIIISGFPSVIKAYISSLRSFSVRGLLSYKITSKRKLILNKSNSDPSGNHLNKRDT